MERTYIAIDLKSFYASVECVERGLNPLTTNLVVADKERTDKTICLAVTPSLKAYNISGRARLFEVVQRVQEVNYERRMQLDDQAFKGKSWHDPDLKAHADWALDYLVAPPRMALYIKYSAQIYNIYLKYVAPEDIHVYSIDEVFIDVTPYLNYGQLSPHDFAMTMIRDVLKQTGITATAGIGSNLYLCKVAMDIVAKHIPADKDGVRIAELDEMAYRRLLWKHRPLTSFWRIGGGIARTLACIGIHTMGQLALASLKRERLLYKLFGRNAELLIDHAWGWEPCTIADIKTYRPKSHSFSSGQVLMRPYKPEEARVVVNEMADSMALDLVDKGLAVSHMSLWVGYDTESLSKPEINYEGAVHIDHYGRPVPGHGTASTRLPHPTSSSYELVKAATYLFDKVVDRRLLVRRVGLVVSEVITAEEAQRKREAPVQITLFDDYKKKLEQLSKQRRVMKKERSLQKALLKIKKRYGKNAILRCTDYLEGATTRERNEQIGGHKA